MKNKIIDPHLHLFNLTQGDYHWLSQESPPFWPNKKRIHHNFSEQALTLDNPLELAGFVHIEAGFDNNQPWREIAWLESSCRLPFKAVAGIDLTLDENVFIQRIQQLLSYHSVVGCRHILDEQAYHLLSQTKVQNNLAYLAKNQLSFDLQMPLADEKSMGLLMYLLNRLPALRLIINHAGWPPKQAMSSTIGAANQQEIWQHWQAGLETLSQYPHCAIKCSGWELINEDYKIEGLQAIISQCMATFGEQRVMLGSNFPLVLFQQRYNELWQSYYTLGLSDKQFAALTYANTAYWYKFTL
ncbi:amidohydrolase family protein [Shewanella surugensis]|uniref:Amidohydrolase family protein n=1 Tax=Shewanella surugensis TaxID=212020 RepID=A0ABT0L815_9GAMM|nr:amidohydrolase family protein [Shewanella surugensis]MCL1123829.1 amidohydrolase family protein [Shewanella surugensis]